MFFEAARQVRARAVTVDKVRVRANFTNVWCFFWIVPLIIIIVGIAHGVFTRGFIHHNL